MEGEIQPKADIGLTTSIFTSRYRGVVAPIMPERLYVEECLSAGQHQTGQSEKDPTTLRIHR
jgi:hypothetical protein